MYDSNININDSRECIKNFMLHFAVTEKGNMKYCLNKFESFTS